MGYKLKSGQSCSCLSGMCRNAHSVALMHQGNTSFKNNKYVEDVHHAVMDLMERDLGVQFNEDERKGEVDVGYEANGTRREAHLKMLPFRVFFEALSSRKPEWFRTFGSNWGAFILLHGIDGNIMEQIKPSIIGDQQWFLHMYKAGGRSDGMVLNAGDIIMRMAGLFPTLDSHMTGHTLNLGGVGHNVNMNQSKLVKKSPLNELVTTLREGYRSVYDDDGFVSPNGVRPDRTTDQLQAEADVYQSVFESVRELAWTGAVPARDNSTFTAPALTQQRLHRAPPTPAQPAPTSGEWVRQADSNEAMSAAAMGIAS